MQIRWHALDEVGPEEVEHAEQRLRALEGGHGDLIDVAISGQSSGHHRHGAREVRIACLARGQQLVARRERPDLSLALHDALAVFEREVKRLRDKRRERPSRGGRPAEGELA